MPTDGDVPRMILCARSMQTSTPSVLLGLALPHGAAEAILELAPFTSCGDTNAGKTVQCHHATASGIVDGGNVIHFAIQIYS